MSVGDVLRNLDDVDEVLELIGDVVNLVRSRKVTTAEIRAHIAELRDRPRRTINLDKMEEALDREDDDTEPPP